MKLLLWTTSSHLPGICGMDLQLWSRDHKARRSWRNRFLTPGQLVNRPWVIAAESNSHFHALLDSRKNQKGTDRFFHPSLSPIFHEGAFKNLVCIENLRFALRILDSRKSTYLVLGFPVSPIRRKIKGSLRKLKLTFNIQHMWVVFIYECVYIYVFVSCMCVFIPCKA